MRILKSQKFKKLKKIRKFEKIAQQSTTRKCKDVEAREV